MKVFGKIKKKKKKAIMQEPHYFHFLLLYTFKTLCGMYFFTFIEGGLIFEIRGTITRKM